MKSLELRLWGHALCKRHLTKREWIENFVEAAPDPITETKHYEREIDNAGDLSHVNVCAILICNYIPWVYRRQIEVQMAM